MPEPSPRGKEKKKAFIDRCMGDKVMTKEYEPKQRRAICEKQWDKAKKKGK